MKVGTRVRTTGKGWSGDSLYPGIEGVIVRIGSNGAFPYICTFPDTNEPDDWPMTADEIEPITWPAREGA